MKTRNLTQSSLQNDPINSRMHGFSFRIFKDEIEVQDVISFLSLDQTLISSILRCRNALRTQEIQWHMKLVSALFEFLEISRASSSVAKNSVFKGEIRRNHPMKRRLAIDGHDHESFDQNSVIISHPSDQRSKIKMCPRYAL